MTLGAWALFDFRTPPAVARPRFPLLPSVAIPHHPLRFLPFDDIERRDALAGGGLKLGPEFGRGGGHQLRAVARAADLDVETLLRGQMRDQRRGHDVEVARVAGPQEGRPARRAGGADPACERAKARAMPTLRAEDIKTGVPWSFRSPNFPDSPRGWGSAIPDRAFTLWGPAWRLD